MKNNANAVVVCVFILAINLKETASFYPFLWEKYERLATCHPLHPSSVCSYYKSEDIISCLSLLIIFESAGVIKIDNNRVSRRKQ